MRVANKSRVSCEFRLVNGSMMKKHSEHTFKNGRPRFVVFIIWDVVCASGSPWRGMLEGGKKRKREKLNVEES